MDRKRLVAVAKSAFSRWQQENASIRAAALAFFIALPLPSLLLLTDELFIFIYGPAQGTQNLSQLIGTLAGPTIQSLINQLMQSTTNPFTSIFGSIASILFTIAGAAGAFLVLQNTLNTIWEIELPKKPTLRMRIKGRLVPFLYVLGAAAIVTLWVGFTVFVFGSVESAVKPAIGELAAYVGLLIVQTILSFATATLLFAVIFKELPDTRIKWQDVALAAVITGVAFTVLNDVFGLYLRSFPVTSVAGAAGALILLLLWLFVIGEILFYGAHFSKCYTEELGSHSRIHFLLDKEPVSERANLMEQEGQSSRAAQARTERSRFRASKMPILPATEPKMLQRPAKEEKLAPSPEQVTQEEPTTQQETTHATVTQNEQVIVELEKKKKHRPKPKPEKPSST